MRRSATVALCALLGTVIAAALLATPAVAAPTVVKAGPAPLVIPAGATLEVKAAARGTGSLSLVLSTSARSARGGTVLKGNTRASRRARVRGVVPTSIAAGERRYVLVCANAAQAVRGKRASCKSAGRAQTSAAGLSERLDAAVAAKRLSKGKAALYSFYAANADPRLPRELRGATTSERPTDELLREASVDLHTYPAAIRKEIVTYFAPPSAPGSPWRQRMTKRKGTPKVAVAKAATTGGAPVATSSASRRKADCGGYKEILGDGPYTKSRHEDWIGLGTSDGNAIVWYQKGDSAGEATAKQYRAALPAIWKRLGGEFRAPKSDAKVDCYHGPDGRFDVYVNSAMVFHGAGGRNNPGSWSFLGVTVPYPSAGVSCTNRPAWIAIKQGQPLWTLAHEFMHAVQFAYKYKSCADPINWWDEGGATWAADYMFPDDQREQKWFGLFVDSPLKLGGLPDFAYTAYPFWMFLHRTQGVGTLRAIFAQLESKSSSVEAVDAAVPGGLARQWPRFAVHLWNNDPIGAAGFPVTEAFAQWDKHASPLPTTEVTDLDLGGTRKVEVELKMQNWRATAPLSIGAYHRVTIADEKIREIELKNALKGSPVGKVQAMARLASGQWKLLEWSDTDPRLCRDNADENVQELIIVSTNAGPKGTTPDFTHKLIGRDSCGGPIEFSGTITVSRSSTNDFSATRSTATMRLVLATTDGRSRGAYLARPGSTWTASAEARYGAGCDDRSESTASGSGTFIVGEIAHARRYTDVPYAHGSGAVQLDYFHRLRNRPDYRAELGLDMVLIAPMTRWWWEGDACVAHTENGIHYMPDRRDWDIAFGHRDIYLKVVTDAQGAVTLSADFDETITSHLGTVHHTTASGTLVATKWEE